MERRTHLRIRKSNFFADVNDGKGVFQGRVFNNFRSGICPTNPTPKPNNDNHRFRSMGQLQTDYVAEVVFTGKIFTIHRIDNLLHSSWKWESFVSRLEPLSEAFEFGEIDI